MSSALSIDLPEPIGELVTQTAFDQYTISGPNRILEPKLRNLDAAELFPGGDVEMRACCLSGLWLLHNFLDQSHEISQDIHSREGSLWHGIMHRLEGDYWNSKYWYRKVGDHPVFELMCSTETWNPADFVDQCESAQSGGPAACNQVHQTAIEEWKTLFKYCFERASSSSHPNK